MNTPSVLDLFHFILQSQDRRNLGKFIPLLGWVWEGEQSEKIEDYID